LNRHVAPDDEVWLYPTDSELPLRAAGAVHYRARGIPRAFPAVGFDGPIRVGYPSVVSLTRAQAVAFATAPAARRVPTIWLVTRGSEVVDPAGDLPRALAQVRRPGPIQAFAPVDVQPFYSRDAAHQVRSIPSKIG
jgi:hypothetical protein